MANVYWIAALGFIVAAASPATATTREKPASDTPTASANGKYCLRVEAITGSKVETVQCMTREEWVAQGVDLDREWAEEGVILEGQPA